MTETKLHTDEKKPDIKGLTIGELEELVLANGDKKFRGKQLFEWLYNKQAISFEEMSSISKPLQKKFSSLFEIGNIKIKKSIESSDGTLKFLLELKDGNMIESVLIPPLTAFKSSEALGEEEQRRLTLCVSTQVGCPLDCVFCSTGRMGFSRNLSSGEIIDQIIQIKKSAMKHITNLVYMGMGEPLLNYGNVMRSIEIITTGMGIAARRITVSTVGIVPGIRQMADEGRKMKLAVSLHSLKQATRDGLMPISKKYPLPELIESIRYYYKKTKLRPTFEYILFDDINDRGEDIKDLKNLSNIIPCKINIIPYHRVKNISHNIAGDPLRPSPQAKMDLFMKKLREAHITVFLRSSAGEDIRAACGQLAIEQG